MPGGVAARGLNGFSRGGGVLLLALTATSCQPPRSAALPPLVREALLARWQEPDGSVLLERWRYRQGPQQGELWVARLQPELLRLSVEVASGAPRPLDELVAVPEQDSAASVAINGAFYDERGPLGLVVSHGHQVQRFLKRGGSGVLVVTEGTTEIVHRDAFKWTPEIRHALQSIDRLVDDGRSVVRDRTPARSDARSLVGIDGRQRLTLAVLYDARALAQETAGVVYLNSQTTSTGVTMGALAELAARRVDEGGLGLLWALNLDGGWSTALRARIQGQLHAVVGYRGTVNAVLARRARATPHGADSAPR